MAQVFEMIMLICFGLSWPFNITKSVRSRTAKGKSLWLSLRTRGRTSEEST